MFYYLNALIYTYLVSRYTRKLPTILIFCLLYPIILFATFRGESGKDTPIYIDRFFGQNIEFSFFSEPLLSILIQISRMINHTNYEVFFALHACFVCFLYSKVIKINQAFALTLGPLFLIDGLTNGMRIVMSYFILLIFSNNYLRSFSFFAHVTSVLPIGIAYLVKNKDRIFLTFFVSITFIFFAILVFNELESLRLLSKFNRYQTMGSANWYSGLVDLFILSILITKFRLGNFKIMLFTLALVTLLLFLNSYSIAFIRVSKLIIIAMFLIPSTQLFIMNNRKVAFLIFFITGVNFMRQVIFDNGFLPYG